jgi:tRNA (guanine37-N1)-methyltransferase
MQIDIISIFPDMADAALQGGVIGRARERGLADIRIRDLRLYTEDRHRTVDDVPFGGGPGMVMKPEPWFRAIEAVTAERGTPEAVILMTPQGKRFTQGEAIRLSGLRRIVLLCGRYEGVDERVAEHLVTDEVSIGDYVLTGGELPALVVLDAVVRLVPGVVGDAASVAADSFERGLLDHPHYTRPAEFRGMKVPTTGCSSVCGKPSAAFQINSGACIGRPSFKNPYPPCPSRSASVLKRAASANRRN